MDDTDLVDQIERALTTGHVQPARLNYSAGQVGPPTPERLHGVLPQLWVDAYCAEIGAEPEIVQFNDGSYHYLFDLNAERVVAAWGESRPAKAERDKSRQAGFIRGFTRHYRGKDRGHFLSHGQGGGMDVNFFPQKKQVNRGWSPAGKLFRAMERHCALHPGTFCFARPLYRRDNETWDPEELEYGLLVGDTKLCVVVFPNT